ncbi:hypothetical protein CDL15_Pgr001451 [Punica granatum]|uniref:Uncharacterized protein n=1 Tax=Punica granatum TaxID=22663 RepID=A0A218WKH6_PUNGR|nr:hypothetical protein CDL15_Pgr001451 [Punica granatum]PKI62881.1 hypothetical protein CRG98_016718 [Punica granatum]
MFTIHRLSPPLPLFIFPRPPSPLTRRDPPRPCPLLRPPLPPTEAALVLDKDAVEGGLPVVRLLRDVRGNVEASMQRSRWKAKQSGFWSMNISCGPSEWMSQLSSKTAPK